MTAEHPEASSEPVAQRADRPGPARQLLMVVVVAVAVVVGIVAVALTRTQGDGALSGTPGDGAAGNATSVEGATPAEGAPPLLAEGGSTGQPLPAVTLPALGDHAPAGGRDLTDLRGQALLVNFWASWCAPCVNEMPLLQDVSETTDVTVIGVDYIDLNTDDAVALVDDLGITYELVTDEDGAFGEQVGLFATPTTLLVDPDGTIVAHLTGELTREQLSAALEDALDVTLPPA